MMGDEATKWFLCHHFRNHGLTVLRNFLKRGFMESLAKAYNICSPWWRRDIATSYLYLQNIVKTSWGSLRLAVLGLGSTIPDGRTFGLEKLEIIPPHPTAGVGSELAKYY